MGTKEKQQNPNKKYKDLKQKRKARKQSNFMTPMVKCLLLKQIVRWL